MLRHLNKVHSFIPHVTAQKKRPYIHSYTGAGYKASKLKNVQTINLWEVWLNTHALKTHLHRHFFFARLRLQLGCNSEIVRFKSPKCSPNKHSVTIYKIPVGCEAILSNTFI